MLGANTDAPDYPPMVPPIASPTNDIGYDSTDTTSRKNPHNRGKIRRDYRRGFTWLYQYAPLQAISHWSKATNSVAIAAAMAATAAAGLAVDALRPTATTPNMVVYMA